MFGIVLKWMRFLTFKKQGYCFLPDRVFKRAGLEIAIRKIKRPLPSRYAYLVLNPWVIIGEANWIISVEEVNERSPHPLAKELRKIQGLIAFSVYGNSFLIDLSPWKVKSTLKAIISALFERKMLEEKTKKLIEIDIF